MEIDAKTKDEKFDDPFSWSWLAGQLEVDGDINKNKYSYSNAPKAAIVHSKERTNLQTRHSHNQQNFHQKETRKVAYFSIGFVLCTPATMVWEKIQSKWLHPPDTGSLCLQEISEAIFQMVVYEE